MNNKKGYSFLTIIFVGFFFMLLIVMVLSIVYSSTNKQQEKTIEQMTIGEAKTRLLVFLRQPIYYSNWLSVDAILRGENDEERKQKYLTMAELIIEAQYDEIKLDKVKEKVEETFEKAYEDKWQLIIVYPGEKAVVYGAKEIPKESLRIPTTFSNNPAGGYLFSEKIEYIPKDNTNWITLPGYENNIEILLGTWNEKK